MCYPIESWLPNVDLKPQSILVPADYGEARGPHLPTRTALLFVVN